MQRDIPTIITAHKMDTKRRTLYVEGERDMVFLKWLAADNLNPDVAILTAEQINTENEDLKRNYKEKLVFCASKILKDKIKIQFFVDADFDRITKRKHPSNLILTDRRDLESYLIRKDCFKKFFELGLCGAGNCNFDHIMKQILNTGRTTGILRLVSELNSLKLKFKETELNRHITVTSDLICKVDLNKYANALLAKQDSGQKISQNQLIEMHNKISEKYKNVDDIDLVHGSDFYTIFEKILRKKFPRHKFSSANIETAIWNCFPEHSINEYPNLNRALNYIV